MPAFSTKEIDQERRAKTIEIGDHTFVPRRRTVGLMEQHSQIEDKQIALRLENEKIREENRELLKAGKKPKPQKEDPHPYADIVVLLEPVEDGPEPTNELLEAELDWWTADQLRAVLFPEVEEAGKALMAAMANGGSTTTSEAEPASTESAPT